MLSRFFSLKEQRAKTSKVSHEDSAQKNKELIFTKLKNEYEVAVSMQAKGKLDSALCIYQTLIEELKRVDYEKTKREADCKGQYSSFQMFPFEIRLHFLCLKNSAYICEERGYWEQVESLYSILVESFLYCVVFDTGLVVRMLRTLKKLGDFSFARKVCELYLREKDDNFVYREWRCLLHLIGDELIYGTQSRNIDSTCSYNAVSLSSSSFIQRAVSFENTSLFKATKSSYFISDARTLLLWIMFGVFYDSNTLPFDLHSYTQVVQEAQESRGILDTSGSLIFPEDELVERIEYTYQVWKRMWNTSKQENHVDDHSDIYNIFAVWNELKRSSQRAGLDSMNIDWSSSRQYSSDNQKQPDLVPNLFNHEQLIHVLEAFPDWDKIEFPSYSCSLFELLCSLLENLSKQARSLLLDLGPFLVYAWLKFRSIFPTIPIQERTFFLNVAELIFSWFPYICRMLNATSSTDLNLFKKEEFGFIPCSFCKIALMECEYLLSRFLECFSEQETFDADVDVFRVYILKAKISSYLCQQDNYALPDRDLSDVFYSFTDDIREVKVAFHQFNVTLFDTWNVLREEQRLIDNLKEFYNAIWLVKNADDWEMQLLGFCQKLRPQLFSSLSEERLHKDLLLCNSLDICIHAPPSYHTDCSLLSCITFKLQVVSKFLSVVSRSFLYSGCTMIMIQQQVSQSFGILKRLSSFLKVLEEKQNEMSSDMFRPEIIANCLILFESLCLLGISLGEMKHRGECLNWLVKGASKYQKRLMFLLLCISKTCELLLSSWESCIIQSYDERVLDLMGRCLALFCVVLRYISQRENLQRVKSFRLIIQVYCTCLRRWMNACDASDKDPFFIIMEWNKNSNSFTEKAENPASELAAGYYYRYGLRAPFISEEDLNSNWLTRELSSQSFIKSLNPAHVVEFYYAFRVELKEATLSNRRGSIGEMKRTLNALLNVFFSVVQPSFEPCELFDEFKSCLANLSEDQLYDPSVDFKRVVSCIFSSWSHRGQRILEHLHSVKGRASVDILEYKEVALDICYLLSHCLSLELEMARKKLKSMSLTAYFVLRRRLLEELFGLQLFNLSLELGRAQSWLWLGEVALELSHIHNELKHLEMDEKSESSHLYFHFEECAKMFRCVSNLLNCTDHLNTKALMQMTLQGEALCYFLAARLTSTLKGRWHGLAVRALDELFKMNDSKPIHCEENVSLIHSSLCSWWYFLLLRGKLGFKLRESVASICWFLREAIVSHREEATRLKQELEVEPFYQFDMIRLKILLHVDEFSFSDVSIIQTILDDRVVYSPDIDLKKTDDSTLRTCIVFDFPNILRTLSNQVIEHMNYVWDSHQFRNGSRSSGYLYKPFYAQAVAYQLGLQMYERALDSVSNLFQPSVANSSIGNFWYMFTATPTSLLSELIFESKAQYQRWKFKCLSIYIQLSALLKQKENLWAAYCRLRRRKPEETDDDLLSQVMHFYFDYIQSTSSEWQDWDMSKLNEELQRLWSIYLFLISLQKNASLANSIQRIMERLLFHVSRKDGNGENQISVLAYCSEKWPALKNRKRRRGNT